MTTARKNQSQVNIHQVNSSKFLSFLLLKRQHFLVQLCGCDQGNLHLHVEIENLKQRLIDRERHIEKMETNFLKEAEKFPNGEYAALMDELSTWQDKYSRYDRILIIGMAYFQRCNKFSHEYAIFPSTDCLKRINEYKK